MSECNKSRICEGFCVRRSRNRVRDDKREGNRVRRSPPYFDRLSTGHGDDNAGKKSETRDKKV